MVQASEIETPQATAYRRQYIIHSVRANLYRDLWLKEMMKAASKSNKLKS